MSAIYNCLPKLAHDSVFLLRWIPRSIYNSGHLPYLKTVENLAHLSTLLLLNISCLNFTQFWSKKAQMIITVEIPFFFSIEPVILFMVRSNVEQKFGFKHFIPKKRHLKILLKYFVSGNTLSSKDLLWFWNWKLSKS